MQSKLITIQFIGAIIMQCIFLTGTLVFVSILFGHQTLLCKDVVFPHWHPAHRTQELQSQAHNEAVSEYKF